MTVAEQLGAWVDGTTSEMGSDVMPVAGGALDGKKRVSDGCCPLRRSGRSTWPERMVCVANAAAPRCEGGNGQQYGPKAVEGEGDFDGPW